MRSVLSLWADEASIDALDTSTSTLYRETVTRFHATGVLREPQTSWRSGAGVRARSLTNFYAGYTRGGHTRRILAVCRPREMTSLTCPQFRHTSLV
jgi:hypothetical protein